MAELKEKIINSSFEQKRKVYLLLYNQALLLTKDVYTISCSEDDYALIKSFSESKKILIDSTLSDSIVLDCGKYKIKSTIDMLLSQYTPTLYELVIKWMEEYR
jgi:type II secretory pathway predicted ATPase ExeA